MNNRATADENSLRRVLDALPDAAFLVAEGQQIAFANAESGRMLGYCPADLIGQSLEVLLPSRYRDAHPGHVARYFATLPPGAMTQRPLVHALAHDGREVPVSIGLSSITIAGVRYAIAVLRDARGVSARLNEARHLAESDPLTGVGNRRCLDDWSLRLISASRPFALLFLDINRFKPLNDRYGHRIGDQVLRTVAQRLLAGVRGGDLVARVGGDEFVVLLDGVGDATLATQHAHRLADAIAQPVHCNGPCVTISAAAGCALFPHHATSLSVLLSIADRAMYRAKRRGAVFDIGDVEDIGSE